MQGDSKEIARRLQGDSKEIARGLHGGKEYKLREAFKKQAENGLQSRSSDNGKTAVWHYGLKLQQYLTGATDWRYGMVWYGFVAKVWFGRGGQMTSEFIHEEISIMDYNGLL